MNGLRDHDWYARYREGKLHRGFNRWWNGPTGREVRWLARGLFTVLFWLSVAFGSLCWYYSNFFHIRRFEPPLEGLTYAEVTDVPQLNEFRKKSIPCVIDPTLQQLDRIKEIRLAYRRGDIDHHEFTHELDQVRNRLKELMTEARLRRIPKKFKRKYDLVILGIKDAFDSLNTLEESFTLESQAARQKMYDHSIKRWKAAKKKCHETRDYFSSKQWQN